MKLNEWEIRGKLKHTFDKHFCIGTIMLTRHGYLKFYRPNLINKILDFQAPVLYKRVLSINPLFWSPTYSHFAQYTS